jgi:hypothetical protein
MACEEGSIDMIDVTARISKSCVYCGDSLNSIPGIGDIVDRPLIYPLYSEADEDINRSILGY